MKYFVLLVLILSSTTLVFSACDNSILGNNDEPPTSTQMNHRATAQQIPALQSIGKATAEELPLSRYAASPAFTHEGTVDAQGNGSFTLTLSPEQPPGAAQSVRWQEAAAMLPTSLSWNMTSMTVTLPNNEYDNGTSEPIIFDFDATEKGVFAALRAHWHEAMEPNTPSLTPPLSAADFQAAGFDVTVLNAAQLEVTWTDEMTGLVLKHRYNIQEQRFEYSETFLHDKRLVEFYPPPM